MNQKVSSIVTKDVQPIAASGHFFMPTWGILAFLVLCFFVLKSFIYIKDDKRHGK